MKRKSELCDKHYLDQTACCITCKDVIVCPKCILEQHSTHKLALSDSIITMQSKYPPLQYPDYGAFITSSALVCREYEPQSFAIYDPVSEIDFDVQVKCSEIDPEYTAWYFYPFAIAGGSLFFIRSRDYTIPYFYRVDLRPETVSVEKIQLKTETNFFVYAFATIQDKYVYVFGHALGLKYIISEKKLVRAPIPPNHVPLVATTVLNDRYIVGLQGEARFDFVQDEARLGPYDPYNDARLYLYILDTLDEEKGWTYLGGTKNCSINRIPYCEFDKTAQEMPNRRLVKDEIYVFEFDIANRGHVLLTPISNKSVLLVGDSGQGLDISIPQGTAQKWGTITRKFPTGPVQVFGGKVYIRTKHGYSTVSYITRESKQVNLREVGCPHIDVAIEIPESNVVTKKYRAFVSGQFEYQRYTKTYWFFFLPPVLIINKGFWGFGVLRFCWMRKPDN
eukprot:TRINITY_DN14384_c0_g1_i1.p1 TRINITY_DN14384_c0_g1~~TRINITY_DN14384_c0_g1_i1.p1  ORF type:complete len:479 (-),score=8.44 TRINITY_DN14384_c0_g1_i1:16-1362(-)